MERIGYSKNTQARYAALAAWQSEHPDIRLDNLGIFEAGFSRALQEFQRFALEYEIQWEERYGHAVWTDVLHGIVAQLFMDGIDTVHQPFFGFPTSEPPSAERLHERGLQVYADVKARMDAKRVAPPPPAEGGSEEG
jgi:hypothetical protein